MPWTFSPMKAVMMVERQGLRMGYWKPCLKILGKRLKDKEKEGL